MAITLPAIYEFIVAQGNDVVGPLADTLESYMQPTSIVRLTVDGEVYNISGTQFEDLWSMGNWDSNSVSAGTLGHLKGFRIVQDSSNSIIYAGFDTEGTHSIQVDAIEENTETTTSGIYKTALKFDSTSEEFSIVEYGTESLADLASHSEDVVVLFDETAHGSATAVGIPSRNSHDGWTCSFGYIVSIVGQGFTFRDVLWTESGFVSVDDEALLNNTQ